MFSLQRVQLIGYTLSAQCDGRIYQSNVAVNLRKVAQQSFGFKIDILTQQQITILPDRNRFVASNQPEIEI
jgi:hypothetical protein